jgi:hypothetical protein
MPIVLEIRVNTAMELFARVKPLVCSEYSIQL